MLHTTDGRFKFILATSEELKRAVYRLRYQVYVEEFGFERPEDHPRGLETDEYDPCSIHLAALNEDDEVVATLRLVLDSEKGFPIERAARIQFIGPKPPADRIAEISRLAVGRAYRRRVEDGFYGVESYLPDTEGGVLTGVGGSLGQRDKRKRPVILLGLYRLMYHVSKRRGLTHWYMVAEKKLWYALKRYHFYFHQIGEPVQYHGVRIPYLAIISEIEERVSQENSDFFRATLVGLEEEYRPRRVSPP